MFKKKYNNLENFRKYSKEKISILGVSIDFDWFVIVLSSGIFIIIVMFFSFLKLREVQNYEPEPDSSVNVFLTHQKTIDDSEKIISNFENKQSSVNID